MKVCSKNSIEKIDQFFTDSKKFEKNSKFSFANRLKKKVQNLSNFLMIA